jgi:hypothetical protein
MKTKNYVLTEGILTIVDYADDYEHSGDTENLSSALKKLGFKVSINWDCDRDDPEAVTGVITLNENSAENMIKRCNTINQKAERTGDYSHTTDKYSIEVWFKMFDSQNNTEYYNRFKTEIDSIQE